MTRRDLNLTIHLAGRNGGVAVGAADNLLDVEKVETGQRYRDDLMPATQRLFARLNAKPDDLAEVYVGVGPGGFTGLRVAVATAKMLALALNVRIVAVPQTQIVAEAVEPIEGVLAICIAGKRGEYWCETFLGGSDGWRTREDPCLIAAGDLAVIPDLTQIVTQHLDEPLAKAADFVGLPVAQVEPDAAACWRVGRRLAQADRFTDARALTPLYAREPEAVRLWAQRSASRG